MSDDLGMAASAMRSAANSVSATAGRIVRMTAQPTTAPVAPVTATQPPSLQPFHVAMPSADLAEELVNLKQGEMGFRAATVAFKAVNRTTKRTLDILT
ncbi:MAG TPA: hypothetical protein VGM36_05505 [Rhizomicrobium sp.]